MDISNSLSQPFNKILNRTIPEIIDKYVALICEYFAFIGEKKNIVHQKQYYYLRTRGLDTISHVFFMMLFYTKNLELTYYHSQKSFYLYVEFIEQIIDVQHSFLQLNSRDATIFVYKKTIYEIIPENRVLNVSDEQFAKLNLFINIYKQIPNTHISDIHLQLKQYPNMTTSQLENVYDYVYNCCESPTYIFDASAFILKCVNK
jgi:hypothetical protein